MDVAARCRRNALKAAARRRRAFCAAPARASTSSRAQQPARQPVLSETPRASVGAHRASHFGDGARRRRRGTPRPPRTPRRSTAAAAAALGRRRRAGGTGADPTRTRRGVSCAAAPTRSARDVAPASPRRRRAVFAKAAVTAGGEGRDRRPARDQSPRGPPAGTTRAASSAAGRIGGGVVVALEAAADAAGRRAAAPPAPRSSSSARSTAGKTQRQSNESARQPSQHKIDELVAASGCGASRAGRRRGWTTAASTPRLAPMASSAPSRVATLRRRDEGPRLPPRATHLLRRRDAQLLRIVGGRRAPQIAYGFARRRAASRRGRAARAPAPTSTRSAAPQRRPGDAVADVAARGKRCAVRGSRPSRACPRRRPTAARA